MLSNIASGHFMVEHKCRTLSETWTIYIIIIVRKQVGMALAVPSDFQPVGLYRVSAATWNGHFRYLIFVSCNPFQASRTNLIIGYNVLRSQLNACRWRCHRHERNFITLFRNQWKRILLVRFCVKPYYIAWVFNELLSNYFWWAIFGLHSSFLFLSV